MIAMDDDTLANLEGRGVDVRAVTRINGDGDEEILGPSGWTVLRKNAVQKDERFALVSLVVTGAMMSLNHSEQELEEIRAEYGRGPESELVKKIDDSIREEAVQLIRRLTIRGRIRRDQMAAAIAFARTAR